LILVDTSAWIEFLRATGSPAHLAVRRLIAEGEALGISEPVVMEVLAGAGTRDVERLRRRLLAVPLVPTDGIADFEQAAAIYRRCREQRETIRSLVDCLIAAITIRIEAELLHADADFVRIARHTGLRIHALR
jgi:predicted nucleic acid-binding protein